MNKQVVAFRRIQTNRPVGEVLQATEDALRRMGGTLYRHGDTIIVQEGTAGISMAFAATVQARATVTPRQDGGGYDVNCYITAAPNGTFWICAVLGFFCMPPLWIVNLMYFLMDLLQPYQRVLDQIDLPGAPGAPVWPQGFSPPPPPPPSPPPAPPPPPAPAQY